MLQKQFSIEARDSHDRTPLVYAALANCVDSAKYLVCLGADINAIDTLWCTPLHYAAIFSPEIVKLLVSCKSIKVNASNIYAQTPLILAAAHCQHTSLTMLLLAGGRSQDTDS